MPEPLELIRRDCARSQVRSYARRAQARAERERRAHDFPWIVGTILLYALIAPVILTLFLAAIGVLG